MHTDRTDFSGKSVSSVYSFPAMGRRARFVIAHEVSGAYTGLREAPGAEIFSP